MHGEVSLKDVNKIAEERQELPSSRARGRHGPRLGAIGGFTHIEALVVVIVLGVLAWIGLSLISIREKAHLVMMKADLKHIATQQAPHASDNYQYANDMLYE